MRNGAEREPGAKVIKIKEGREGVSGREEEEESQGKSSQVKSSVQRTVSNPEVPRRLGGASPSDALLRYSYNVQGGHPNHWHYH